MELGMGIHGEPGVETKPLESADKIAEALLSGLLRDMPLNKADRVSVLCNSLGATPLEELYILYRYVDRRLRAAGVEAVSPLVGRLATSMEMTGLSLTLLKLDSELESLLLEPCDSPFLKC